MEVKEVRTWLGELGLSDAPKVSKAEVKSSGKVAEKGRFTVIAVHTKRPMLELLRAPQNRELVNWMARMPKARVITAVATTMGHSSTRESSLEGTVSASLSVVSAGPGAGTVHVKSTRNSTVKYGDGTVFAYEMSIPAWRRDSQGRLYIADYVEDRPGPSNPNPAPGTSLDPDKAPQDR
jgi:hypothetical protein